MRSLKLQIFAVLFFTISILAQEKQSSVLIDEYGKMPMDERLARMEALAVRFRQTPNSGAYVRISGGQNGFYALPYRQGSIIKACLQNNLGLPADKISVQFCDLGKTPLWQQFFIVSENGATENCGENPAVPKESVLFDVVPYYFSSEIAFNPIESGKVYMEGPTGDYSKFALDILKIFLKDSPAGKLYVIAYLNTNFETGDDGKIISRNTKDLDSKSVARRMIGTAKTGLLKNGFSPAQIVTVDGGYVNENGRRLELWFVPTGGKIPKPTPDYFPKRTNKPKKR